HAGDVAGGVGAAALGLDLEVEGGAIGVFVVLEHDVGTALDLCGAVLPHRLGIVAVVGHLDAVLGIGRDVAGDGQPGHRDVTLDGHGRLQGDGCGTDDLGAGGGEGSRLGAAVPLDGDGMLAVQDFLELCRRAGRLEGEGRPAGDAAADLGGAPIQLLGDGQAVAVLIGRRIAEAEGCILLPQVYARGAALAGDGGGCVGRDRTIVRDRECRGKYKSGAHAVGVVVVPDEVVAVRVDVPDVAGAVRVRRAGPPAGGRTVVLCNTFLVGCRAGSGGEVIQLRAVHREIGVITGGPA